MDREHLLAEIVEDMSSMRRMMWHGKTVCPANSPTRAQMGILFMLAHVGPKHLNEVAKHLCMTPSAATQLIDGLVESRMVARTPDKDDRRKITLTLTALGERKMNETKARHLESLKTLLNPLNDEELAQWNALQKKILKHNVYVNSK